LCSRINRDSSDGLSSNYGFGLPLCYLKTFIEIISYVVRLQSFIIWNYHVTPKIRREIMVFVLFRLDIVFSALLRFTDSDYPFGIFKLFLKMSVVSLISLG
jgi:hypothetical protein